MKPSDSKVHKAQLMIAAASNWFEILVAAIVIIAILISLIHVPDKITFLYQEGGFNEFLISIFDIVIGIELLKMFCRHNLDSVVEVMIFTVSREMIIEHMPILDTLIGIAAIALLFVIRKFLFVSALDKQDPPINSKPDDRG
ncbi:hypothetical protein [Clostridium sp. AM58-1XD]|uniref:hypothetical protein n=1 Tax=Clostridium sp. AM58-1XD TaxID=2292307 RepID=UPI000E50B6BE|nr:hypothetical protein [Clostridium sp. AM58-1XD]RGY99458.1 hypothetical protein DXA13_08100 [Clostridium sp. AM58-1XD]